MTTSTALHPHKTGYGQSFFKEKWPSRNSLAFQWFRFLAFPAKGPGSLVGELRTHKLCSVVQNRTEENKIPLVHSNRYGGISLWF